MFLSDFLPEKWQTVLKNWISVRSYHEVLKNLAESIRSFRRKSDMFSILGGGGLDPLPPLIGEPDAMEILVTLSITETKN